MATLSEYEKMGQLLQNRKSHLDAEYDARGDLQADAMKAQIWLNPMVQAALKADPNLAGRLEQNLGSSAGAQDKIAAYDASKARIQELRDRPLESFTDPFEPPTPEPAPAASGDKYGGLSATEYLAKVMAEKYGVLDEDGYTEDRADKQGVDEFMDLFQPPEEQGRDTPPQWAFDQGAVPPDYDTSPDAGYGGYPDSPPNPLPGSGSPPPGGGGGDPFMPPPASGPPINWSNYVGGGPNDAFYSAQAQALKGQNDQLMGQQYQAQQARQQGQGQPSTPAGDPWGWVEGGLPSVSVAGGAGPGGEATHTWRFAEGVTPGMTNLQAFGVLEDRLSDPTRAMLAEGFGPVSGQNPTDAGSMVQFASGKHMDPNWYLQRRDPATSPQYQGALDEFINTMYQRSDLAPPVGGGPTAAPGYALPVGGS